MSSSEGGGPLVQIEVDDLKLREDESTLLQEECAAVLAQPLPVTARDNFARLQAAAAAGEVPQDLQESLQSLLEVGLESGRIRHLHGAHAEMAAVRLYGRLPRGRSYRESVAAANEALATLEGHPIATASFQARGPASCTFTIDAGARRITISIRRTGLAVESVEAVV
ncbi:MAG: hypothetical protein LC772_04265 [Chloroflexi bacterium]|nr:hypothetical protein [Chloroflexota bacterium]